MGNTGVDATAVPRVVHGINQDEKPGEVSFLKVTAVEVFLLCLQPVPAAPHVAVHLGSSIWGKSQGLYIFRGGASTTQAAGAKQDL